MTFKKLFLSVTTLFIFNSSYGQFIFMSETGIARYSYEYANIPSLLVKARYVVAYSNELSFSLGTSAAFGFKYNKTDNTTFTNIDYPVLLQVHFGAGSTDLSEFKIGGYVASGFGMNNIISDNSFSKNEAYGIQYEGGLNYKISDGFAAGIRYSKLKNLTLDMHDVSSMSITIGYKGFSR